MRFLDVACPNAGSQAVTRVIGLSNQRVGIAEWNCGDYRSKDFLLYYFHILVCVDQHRGLHEIPLVAVALSSSGCFRAFREASLEISAYAIKLLGGNQRPHVG